MGYPPVNPFSRPRFLVDAATNHVTTEPLTDPRFPQLAVAVYDDSQLVGFLWGLSEVEEQPPLTRMVH